MWIIKEIYPKQYWWLLSWILIWEKSDISKEIKDEFNKSWLSHILAVSGFNVTILIIFLSLLFRFLPWYFRFIVIAFFITFYYLIVWENIPALRASIMWIVSYLSIINIRKLENFNILMAIIFILVLINPLILNYDISFHLSFLAVFWIIYTQDFFKKIFSKIPETLSIKDSLVITLSALVFTIPIILVNFGQMSIISPLSNVLVAPAIPLSMLFWFLSIITYNIHELIWISFWFFSWIFLKYIMIIADFLGNLSFSFIFVNLWSYKYLFEFIYFILIIFLILYFKKEEI